MKKLTGAKRLHRKYEVDEGFTPSFEHERVGNIIEFDAKLEEQLKQEHEEHEEQLAKARGIETLEKIKGLHTAEIELPQRSAEWFRARAGIITGSDTPFNVDGKPIPTFDAYVFKKVATKFKYDMKPDYEEEESYSSQAMNDGNKLEGLAIERYEKQTGKKVVQKGIYTVDDYPIGASPDGVAFDNDFNQNIVEVKNLQLNTFVAELINPTQAKKYKAQLQMEMLCSGIHKAELVLQCAFQSEKFELLIYHIELDAEYISNMMETISLYDERFSEAYRTLEKHYKDF